MSSILSRILSLTACLSSPSFAASLLPLHHARVSAISEFQTTSTLKQASHAKQNSLSEINRQHSKEFAQYQQYYYGYPVIAGEITKRGDQVTGQLIQDIQLAPEYLKNLANGPAPELALLAAKNQFLNSHRKTKWTLSQEKSELVIKWINQQAVPVFYIQFHATTSEYAPIFHKAYVSAEPPYSTLIAWNNIQYFTDSGPGGNDRTGFYRYGEGSIPHLTVTAHGSECIMIDSDNQYRVVDMRGHQDDPILELPYMFAFSYRCGDTQRDINPYFGASSVDDDAYYATKNAIDMYRDWYAERPLEEHMIIRTHYPFPFFGGIPYSNAFYEEDFNTFNIGDGDFPEILLFPSIVGMYPLASPDIIGHEFAHAYTAKHSGLVYRDQSGALNESFSDMSGVATMEYLRLHQKYLFNNIYHSKKTVWTLGSSVMRSNDPNLGLRYMDQPSKDDHSADCWDKSLISDESCRVDYQDVLNFAQSVEPDDLENQQGIIVHFASGIYNHWFYILANKPNWTIKKAFGLALKANGQGYWQANSTFEQAACGIYDAAESQNDKLDILDAFRKVGLNTNSCLQSS